MGPSVSFPLPLTIAQKLPVRNSWELIIKKLPIPLPTFLLVQGSVSGGFQTVVRVFWDNEIPLPPFYLNLTFLPQVYLFLTSF